MRAVVIGVLAGMVLLATGVADAQRLVMRIKVPGLEGASTAPTQPERMEPDPAGAFITVWDTTQPGIVNDRTVTLPLVVADGYPHDLSIDCGAPAVERIKTITDTNLGDAFCEYPSPGTYTVTITSPTEQMGGWTFAGAGDYAKLLQIQGWGPFRFGLRGPDQGEFEGASNMTVSASVSDVPTITGDDLSSAFVGASALTTIPNMNQWDTSSVTNMAYMFSNAGAFNGDISGWDTSSVGNMYGMFWNATVFNGDISSWDTRSVTSMSYMFSGAATFDGDISGWDTRSVSAMHAMFWDAIAFNGNISGWEPGGVTDMNFMFQNAAAFSQDLSCWDVAHNPGHHNFNAGAHSDWVSDSSKQPQWGVDISTDPTCNP